MKRTNLPIVFLLFAPVALPQAAGPGPAVEHFYSEAIEAKDTVKRLEAQGPRSCLNNLTSAQLLKSMEKDDDALVQYTKAPEKEPSFRNAHYNICKIYWLEGKWDLAIFERERELKTDSYYYLATWYLATWEIGSSLLSGNAYRRLGRTMEADAETRIGQKMTAKVRAAREPKP